MWTFLVLLFCVCQMGLGLVVGMRLRRHPPPAEAGAVRKPDDSGEPDRRQAVALRGLATGIAEDVASHSDRIEQANQRLNVLFEAENPAERAELASTISEILQANQALQDQLAAAHTQLEQQAKEIDARAVESRTDSLTGVANRRACDEELARQCSGASQSNAACSILMIDVDHFKKFNDSHGHDAGDHVLRSVAQTIAQAVQTRDLISRFGGEEFCAILPNTSMDSAAMVAERIRKAVGTSNFQFQGIELNVTLSLGVATIAGGETSADVLKRADAALYAAKRDGRDCSHLHDGVNCRRIGLSPPAQNQGDEGASESARHRDRRVAQRHAFELEQAIARHQGDAAPDPSCFRTVKCKDISATGCSFVSDRPLEFNTLVVALGVPPKLTYVAAKVAYVVPYEVDGTKFFRVGCRFLRRISAGTQREIAVAAANA